LEILSRITVPTKGEADLFGRVGALLEVGAGFSGELTGRENVYVNGAILGMRKAEINARFDDIVEFAGVGDYLDTPVKRYSSGMYTRLAFSVAAHLESEILFIDEVLSVGDQKFQEKSLGKMRDVATSGRTVLFVSHNMAAVTSLCSRAILLDNGRIVEAGTTHDVIDAYLRLGREASSTPLEQRLDRSGDGTVRFTSLALEDESGEPLATATSGRPVTIRLDYASRDGRPVHNAIVQIAVMGIYGQPLFVCLSRVAQDGFSSLAPEGSIRCRIPTLPLLPGVYMLDIWCKVHEVVTDRISHASELTVSEGDFFGSGKLPPREGGEFLVVHEWDATEE
jgi:lipopolysaccharide transport system ATP-binding protein